MGLNVNQDTDFFEKSGLVNAASLYTLTGNKYDKMLAAEYIVDELTRLIDEDFSTVINEYSQRCITLGKTVKLVQNNTKQLHLLRLLPLTVVLSARTRTVNLQSTRVLSE